MATSPPKVVVADTPSNVIPHLHLASAVLADMYSTNEGLLGDIAWYQQESGCWCCFRTVARVSACHVAENIVMTCCSIMR